MVLRNRAYNAGAIVAIVSTTALMWSDTAISWWSNIIEFALRINSTATQEVLDSRPSGDADLHALVWGGCAVAVGFAVNWQKLQFALITLFGWTVCVEIAQPWFTTMRSRQMSDLLGNSVGILSVLVVVEIVKQVRARR
jgi:hypothetical protein